MDTEHKEILYSPSSIAGFTWNIGGQKIKHPFMHVGERMRMALDRSGISQAEIARRLKESPQTVHSWLTTGSIDKRKLVAFARETGTRLEWLITGQGSPTEAPATEGKYLYPRAYDNVVAGLGRGRFNEDYHIEVEGTVPVPASLIAARGWRVERLAVVKTDGLSMWPTLNESEPVVVNLDETKIVSNRVYAINDPDEGLRIKRLSKQRDGRILVRSDNPDKITYPDDYLTPESSTQVVARVVYRSGEL